MSKRSNDTAVAALIERLGSDQEVAEKIGQKPHVCRDWRRRGSIPLSHWPSLYDLGVTANELLLAHDVAADGVESDAA